jgi:VWFA-related protein
MLRAMVLPMLWLCVLQAQEPSPPPATVFSVGTTLIQIDSVATDSKGRQVTNLTPEDFQVLVDGKAQRVTHFSYIHLDSPDVNKPSLSAEALHQPLPSANPADVIKPADVRRSMVLVVDDLSLSFESMYSVRQTLTKFIDEQMQPGDLVALWETGRNNSVFQQFTSDKRVLAAAVENLRWNPRGLGLVDPFEPLPPNRPNGTPRSGAPAMQQERRTEVANDTAYVKVNATIGALDTLGQLMDELRPVGGRKAVVLFSDGIYLPGIAVPGEDLEAARRDELMVRFRRLIDKANRSGAVVYTVDARGLVYRGPEKIGGLWLSQAGLVQLAEDTGGFATVNSNGLSDAVQRIEEEQKGYYLIGFKAPDNISTGNPASKADYHSIKVKVNAPGLHAHSRSGFFGETDEAARPKYDTRQAQMMAAVQSLFNKSDLHVRMTALYRRTGKGQTVVHNLLYIDPRDITFRTDLFGSHYAALDIVIMASGYGADGPAGISRHIAIDANDDKLKQLQRDGLLFTLDVPVKQAGPYQIRACVLDSTSRATGSAGQYIAIPDLKKQHIALTTPLIDDVSAPGEARFNDVSSALREFRAGSRLAFAFHIETDKGGSAPQGKFDAQVQLYRDRTPILDNPVAVAPVRGEDGRAVRGELRLSGSLPVGQYYLQAMATDRSGKAPRNASSWIEFQVVE